jgi:D-glycero-D-manno-heptose 1,7-bisphosphate phosphatase
MNSAVRRAVFIDRDGVINRMHFEPEFGIVDSPANPDQFNLLPGVGRAISTLGDLGLTVIVVSNQPGIAKGKFSPELLTAMERKMAADLAREEARLDAVYNCLHHPEAVLPEYRIVCDCRKPKPGLLLKAASDWAIDLSRSYTIGDGVTDVAAGKAAGTTTFFVNSRKCYNCDSLRQHSTWPDYIVSDLSEAATVIKSIESQGKSSVDQFKLNCAS